MKNYCLSVVLLVSLIGTNVYAQSEDQYYSDNCTSIIVGKNASEDGSTMTSHSCDSGTDRTWINKVPAKDHAPGEMCKVYKSSKRAKGPTDTELELAGEIPQVPHTYAYINTAYAVMNEHQLAIGETTFGGKRLLRSEKGVIDAPELYRLILERAKTAREAIKVADELTKKFGYNDYGECFTFADPEETWHFEILGPGKDKLGAVWAAQRIPDDEVGVSANASRIRQLDLDDTENFMASDNVFSLAKDLDLWADDDGEFEFCYAYGSRTSLACRRREWRVLDLLAPSLNLDANAENYPFSVKPEKKVSVQDMFMLFRDYYEGTPYDMTKDIRVSDREGKSVLSPVANPYMSSAYRQLFKVSRERTIAVNYATYVQVTQSRSWLPNSIGGLVWICYDNPATGAFLPFYCGISEMPEAYKVDGREKFREDCAWWAYRRVSKLCHMRFQDMFKYVDPIRNEMEKEIFDEMVTLEQKALDLYQKKPKKANTLLTEYTTKTAEKVLSRYWQLGDELWSKFARYF